MTEIFKLETLKYGLWGISFHLSCIIFIMFFGRERIVNDPVLGMFIVTFFIAGKILMGTAFVCASSAIRAEKAKKGIDR